MSDMLSNLAAQIAYVPNALPHLAADLNKHI